VTPPKIHPGPPYDYHERLVQALMICESFPLGEGQTADRGHIERVLQDRIYPMVLEWSNLPFLPPAELLVLFDRFAVPPEEITYSKLDAPERHPWIFFGATLKDRDGEPLVRILAEELDGLSRLPVRQAVRARALAIVCPTPALPGSFTASISELRPILKSDLSTGMAYHRILKSESWKVTPDSLLAGLDQDWMVHQLGSWDRKSIRSFLGGRLRRSNLKDEAIGGRIDAAARSLTSVLRTIVESRTPKLDSIDALLETVRSRPRGELAEAVLRRVLPMVDVSDVAWAHQELPTGGYADISTRGTFDRLLISNLAYPEEEFARRLTEGELLYYELEAPPATQPPKQFVFLDGSPATWGIPRLAGGAVALSVVNRARDRRAEAQVFGAGRMDRPFGNLDRASGVHELLDHQRWNDDLKSDLRFLATQVLQETKGHPTGADLFLCTEADRLREIHEWAGSSELPPQVRLHVFASDQVDGRATLWRREGGAFLPLSSLSLALKDLQPEPTVHSAPVTALPLAIAASTIEVNWDWGSNITCAAIDGRGLGITGHANGEVHLWDSLRAVHLRHRLTFPHSIVSVAISEGHAVVSLAKEVAFGAGQFGVFSFAVGNGGFIPVASARLPRDQGAIRTGWEPAQFFWWSSPSCLVEYRADTFAIRTYENLHKSPSQLFVVDPLEKVVLWRDVEGRIMGFDLREKKPVHGSRYYSVLQKQVRHRAVDAEGRVAVDMTAAASTAEVQWLLPMNAGKPDLIERCQPPKAVSAAANRLIAANTDSIWFWALKEPKLIKEIVCPRQTLIRVSFGCAEHSQKENALLLEFGGGSGFVFHWYPDERDAGAVQVDLITQLEKKIYLSHLHGGAGVFRSRSTYAVKPGTGESPIPAGVWRLNCRSNRCIEFLRSGIEEPLLRFWFRQKPLIWVLASTKFTAGTALGSLIQPEGTLLLKNPARLARLLAKGTPDHD